jgi:hypothetical protein
MLSIAQAPAVSSGPAVRRCRAYSSSSNSVTSALDLGGCSAYELTLGFCTLHIRAHTELLELEQARCDRPAEQAALCGDHAYSAELLDCMAFCLRIVQDLESCVLHRRD